MNVHRLDSLAVPGCVPCAVHASPFQQGASLIVTLLLMVVILMLGLSAASIAIQGEKAARSDRERQIAQHAAEAALLDAELDIDASPDPVKSRSAIFSQESAVGFPLASAQQCVNNESLYFGLCRKSSGGNAPAWQTLDFLNESQSAQSVPYGTFTGRKFQTGKSSLPSKLPRYIIELIPFAQATGVKEPQTYLYRITAIGFGVRSTTQVVLQTYYRKEGALSPPKVNVTDKTILPGADPEARDLAGQRPVANDAKPIKPEIGNDSLENDPAIPAIPAPTVPAKHTLPSGRLSWREVANWQELHHAAAQ